MTIAAVVLAAGLSRRMGRPKLVMPWGETTVIGRVVSVLLEGGVEPVVVVTGGAHEQVAAALAGRPVRTVFNPRYEQDSMLISLQTGLAELPETVEAALVVLGDQPQIELPVVQAVISEYHVHPAALIVPSYHMRRGHPWLVERRLWVELFALRPEATLRDFLAGHAGEIFYLPMDNGSILQDLDTFEDYDREMRR
jgi:molybdenum cofactor cytidylyltransferase